MNNRLSKSIKRLEKLNLIKPKDKVERHRDLSAYEVKVFRQLRDKYDLSVEKNEISTNQKNETELTNNAKVTLERIKKGEWDKTMKIYAESSASTATMNAVNGYQCGIKID